MVSGQVYHNCNRQRDKCVLVSLILSPRGLATPGPALRALRPCLMGSNARVDESLADHAPHESVVIFGIVR
ncbi:hypothetical protein PC116_g23757 [Phytophthora cactorum]|uniref:Uncharacterized protein n=1 Tax=Phytophthora cactorum TaxID=29920 RepID=A0A8T1BMG1_9STRA|nr:hypothetical protein PC117_g20545 [Phytophthora cactorum]KAG4227873.1 hypothetical protein PC116_g23757 [Phytophthora cactorum]